MCSSDLGASVVVTGPTGKVTLTWSPVAGADSYRIYRGTSAGNENTYYSVDGSGSAGFYSAPSYTDTGASGTSGSPKSVTTAYLAKTGDAKVTSAVNSGLAVRLVEQLQPGPNIGDTSYSTGLYAKVDMHNQTNQVFGIFGEVVNQPDGSGGFLRVDHKGQGDSIYVALLESAGIGLEAATFKDGTRGIISTVQDQGSGGQYGNITLFTALWQQDQAPNGGAIFASQFPANAAIVQKFERNAYEAILLNKSVFYCNPSATQLRLMEQDQARERFALQNNGTLRWGMSVQSEVTGAAVSGASSLSTANDYYYVVTVVNAAGVESFPSSWGRANPTGALPSIKVDWAAVPGRSSYKLYRAAVTHTTNSTPPALSAYQLLTTTTNNTFTDTGASASGAIPATGNPLVAQLGMGSGEPSFLLASNFGLGIADRKSTRLNSSH